MKRYRLASPEAMRLDVPDELDPRLLDRPECREKQPEPEPDIEDEPED